MYGKTGLTPDDGFSGISLFFGLALVVLGLVAVATSVLFTIGTVLIFGGILVAAGGVEWIHAFRDRRREPVWLDVLSGLVYLLAGGLMLTNPVSGALSLTLVMGIFFLIAGVLRGAYAIAHRKERHWGWFLLSGIIDLGLGTLILTGWPVTGLWVIGLFVGIEMLVHGSGWIALSVMMRRIEKAVA